MASASGGDLDNSTGIDGATDGTPIGNVSDSIKAYISNPGDIVVNDPEANSSTLRWEDMGTGTGGVGRDTSIGGSFTTVYSVNGSGIFLGFLLSLEDMNKWFIRLRIDGTDIFNGSAGLSMGDFDNSNLYEYKEFQKESPGLHLGFSYSDQVFRYEPRSNVPRAYASSIVVQARYTNGSKKFRAGLALRTV